MDFVGLMLKPSGFWADIIFGLETFVKDYGLTLILITLIIKTVMLPFDIMNKYIAKYNARKQAKIKPELDKLQKSYANNPQVLNQKTMELYKKENFSVVGSCLGMLVNMVITMIVFFTLFGALNNIAVYKQADEFVQLYNTYYDTRQVAVIENPDLTEQELDKIATDAVLVKYDAIKSDFLWIKNIWRPDTSKEAITSYKQLSKETKNEIVKILKQQDENAEFTAEVYNKIMSPVKKEYGGANGYYILILLSAIITYVSMQLTTWLNVLKAKKQGKIYTDPVGSNKVLTFMLPIILAIFTLFYNAAFGIYIVTGALFSLVTTPFITMLVDAIDDKVIKKEQNKNTVSYSRNINKF